MALRLIIIVGLIIGNCYIMTGQSIQPDSIGVRIAEATLNSCGDISDEDSEKICFDIFFSINEKGWMLHSYNIWVDFGANDSIISHLKDQSCFHNDGGDTDIGRLGKYRLIAGQKALYLEPKEEYLIHNVCFKINDKEGLEGLQLNVGGDVYGLLSSVNLVDQDKSNSSCNPVVSAGEPFTLINLE